ncbi:hypothetical protein B0T14DRAFT_559269 [Immersiella caudata]|uniref:Uncharacterized protein n=1 Tax=Immersiella caudata TaxID=314043 RepID=A0AA39XCL3_9PEZI|nr:hypothetical protein B0T14DRAFT_559269 [Immersiella caudata]
MGFFSEKILKRFSHRAGNSGEAANKQSPAEQAKPHRASLWERFLTKSSRYQATAPKAAAVSPQLCTIPIGRGSLHLSDFNLFEPTITPIPCDARDAIISDATKYDAIPTKKPAVDCAANEVQPLTSPAKIAETQKLLIGQPSSNESLTATKGSSTCDSQRTVSDSSSNTTLSSSVSIASIADSCNSKKSSGSPRGAERGVFFGSGSRDDDRFTHRYRRRSADMNILSKIIAEGEESSSTEKVPYVEETSCNESSITDSGSLPAVTNTSVTNMGVALDVHSIDFDTLSPINLADTFTLKHPKSVESLQSVDLGHDGNICASSCEEPKKEKVLNSKQALVNLDFVTEKTEYEFAPVVEEDQHIKQPSRQFSLGDAIDGYEWSAEMKQYVPVEAIAKVEKTETVETVSPTEKTETLTQHEQIESLSHTETIETLFKAEIEHNLDTENIDLSIHGSSDIPAVATNSAVLSITDDIDALLATGNLNANDTTTVSNNENETTDPFSNYPSTPVRFPSVPAQQSADWDFIIWEAVYYWDVPRRGGIQYALGNDGELYWYSPDTYEFMIMNETDKFMFAEDYPDSWAALERAFVERGEEDFGLRDRVGQIFRGEAKRDSESHHDKSVTSRIFSWRHTGRVIKENETIGVACVVRDKNDLPPTLSLSPQDDYKPLIMHKRRNTAETISSHSSQRTTLATSLTTSTSASSSISNLTSDLSTSSPPSAERGVFFKYQSREDLKFASYRQRRRTAFTSLTPITEVRSPFPSNKRSTSHTEHTADRKRNLEDRLVSSSLDSSISEAEDHDTDEQMECICPAPLLYKITKDQTTEIPVRNATFPSDQGHGKQPTFPEMSSILRNEGMEFIKVPHWKDAPFVSSSSHSIEKNEAMSSIKVLRKYELSQTSSYMFFARRNEIMEFIQPPKRDFKAYSSISAICRTKITESVEIPTRKGLTYMSRNVPSWDPSAVEHEYSYLRAPNRMKPKMSSEISSFKDSTHVSMTIPEWNTSETEHELSHLWNLWRSASLSLRAVEVQLQSALSFWR